MWHPPLNEGRPFRAGNPGYRPGGNAQLAHTLNEGRPFRAGNPESVRGVALGDQHRSTKAGPSGPATHATISPPTVHPDICSLNEGRPFRAGNPGK